MYNDRINLTIKDLLEQDFSIVTNGYRPQEVDKYLDLVIRDYTEYLNIIKSKDAEIRTLNDEITSLKQEIRHLNNEIETKEDTELSKTSTNVDLLKRISKLEKVVYGSNEQ